MRTPRLWFLVVAVGLIGSPAAHAWGAEGHRTVGTLAERLIAGSHAGAQVQALLGNLSLADVASWADCARNVDSSFTYQPDDLQFPECKIFETPDGKAALVDFVRRNASNCLLKPGEETCHKQYHYSDIAIQHMTYQPAFAGARDDDVVAAVAAMTHVLKGDPTPAPFNIKDKAEALRLLTHYVGDIHQPLHVGAVYLDAQGSEVNPDTGTFDPTTATHGGNSIFITPVPKNTPPKKLHGIWDAIPKALTVPEVNAIWVAAAGAIATTVGSDLDWPKQWASESVVEANLAFSGLTFGPLAHGHWTVTLPAGYSSNMTPIQKRQLTRAGARLAQLLQDIWP
jgi:hypothetical protein